MVVPKLDPDLIVSDLMLDGRGGLELTQQIVTFHPHVPVLIVSMLDEQLYAQRALSAGARGYVMKRSADDEVIRAAHEVLAGRIYVSEAVRKQMQAADPMPEQAMTSPVKALTDRELEVFLLIGQGYAPRHVAEQLNLSVSTVEVYRERLKEKLGLKSSPVLLRYAIRWCKDHNLP
jgi:DNA-binding NarL/FixJ family response regulator